MICYESIFPELSREFALRGAGWVANVTNNIWFGKSLAGFQHAEMGRVRAVESGVTFMACTNTGPSMIVDPYGRVTQTSGFFTREIISGDVYEPLEPTLFRRYGDWLAVVCLIALLAFMIITFFEEKKKPTE